MQPEPPASDPNDEHVLTASGEFDVHDAPIDLGVYRVEDWIAFAFFWVLAGTVFLQFFTRYALNDSAGWTEEIARYLLICTVFIGATISVRRNNHIHVDFFYRYLPRPVTRVLSTFVDAFRIAFFSYAAWLTFALMQRIGAQRMAVVDLPIGLMYGVVLAGFVLMTWRALGVARANWRRGASVLEQPELAFGAQPDGSREATK
ncbi:MAG: TRAP transporter small permease [Burkholderiaceae bacterium]|jgi:TRAP-type C4-dicarboxylate transport system permease small subunit|nr:TRAP transporter small permease [Burkholderiaceae bacterium]MDH5207566.1 TRAP transporter small permease [Burkholderiaceae bacterium]